MPFVRKEQVARM
ncbi:UNVERIFIED_CONTAM: hypothetical protein GTU68_005468 [Idotea baltica]|nr:hypothetical protein [Idotea baltica]